MQVELVHCIVSIGPAEARLDKKSSFTLFRILQESLANVARHAAAGRVGVRLEERGRRLELSVEDDGTGITRSQSESPTSFGIIGMRERVSMLGGTFEIKGSQGNGTTVRVTIPLRPPRRAPSRG